VTAVLRRLPAPLVAALLLAAACSSDIRQMRDQAEARWREGKYEDAARLNQLLYDRDARGRFAAPALLDLGTIYYLNLRQLDRAIATFQKIIVEFPHGREARRAREQLAEIYRNEIGDLTQAIHEYEKLLESDAIDNRSEIQFRMADTFFKLNDFDRALRELRRIEDGGVSGHLADQVRLKIGSIYQIRKRYEDAAAVFDKASGSPCIECRRRAVFNLAETYELMFDYERAIATIQKLDRTPEDEARIAREVARLADKQQRVNATPVEWERH
jgi:outer membrane protein assembly factor BamD (BamD/ComL family)